MLNWSVRKRTAWSLQCVYLKNELTNHTFNIYVKTGFEIKLPTTVDMPKTKPNQTNT